MKKNIVIGIIILLIVVAIGWVIAHQTTDRHVSSIQAEIKLLEATLEEAAKKFHAGIIEEPEVHSYNDRISTHLDRVDEHPWSASVVGYSDFHLDIFDSLASTLEGFKEEHNDMLVAFNTDSFDIDTDINLPPIEPTTVTDTDVFDNAILAFNDAWLYCPGTDPKCWDPGTFFD